MSRLYVREDDTVVCRDCYEDEGGDHVARPPHREIHGMAAEGACASCGASLPAHAQELVARLYDARVVLRTMSPIAMRRAFLDQPYFGDPAGGLDGSLVDDVVEAANLLRMCAVKLTQLGVDVDKLDL